MSEKPKQVIVIRKDLKMQRGKEIAQGSHASMAFLTNRLKPIEFGAVLEGYYFNALLKNVEIEWVQDKFTKVTLQVDSEAAMRELHAKALEAGLESNLIEDSGLTVFHGVPTITALAIGPDLPSRIDPITKNLKLY